MDRLIAGSRPTEVVFGRPVGDKDPMRPIRAASGSAAGGNLITAGDITASEYGIAMQALDDLEHSPPMYNSFREPTPPSAPGAGDKAACASFPLAVQPSMHRV